MERPLRRGAARRCRTVLRVRRLFPYAFVGAEYADRAEDDADLPPRRLSPLGDIAVPFAAHAEVEPETTAYAGYDVCSLVATAFYHTRIDKRDEKEARRHLFTLTTATSATRSFIGLPTHPKGPSAARNGYHRDIYYALLERVVHPGVPVSVSYYCYSILVDLLHAFPDDWRPGTADWELFYRAFLYGTGTPTDDRARAEPETMRVEMVIRLMADVLSRKSSTAAAECQSARAVFSFEEIAHTIEQVFCVYPGSVPSCVVIACMQLRWAMQTALDGINPAPAPLP